MSLDARPSAATTVLWLAASISAGSVSGAGVLGPPALLAQEPRPGAAALEARLAEAAAANRYPVHARDDGFVGSGWDLLLEEGARSRFFLVGEEHGVAEIPAVVRELFVALRPAGYDRLAIEISAPMATALDELARGEDGLSRLSAFFRDNPPGVAFFTLREEAELLVAARAAVDGPEPVLWGMDYEVMADRVLLDGVRRRAPDGPAREAAEALFDASATAWRTVLETRDPRAFFTFSAPPSTLDGIAAAWPDPDPESALALRVIWETLAINEDFMEGRNWESNDRRARFNRDQLLRHLARARDRGEEPRVLFKFGASHMVRGRNTTEVFDLGSLAAELAAAQGARAFHLLVVGGAGSERAVFDPVSLAYTPAPVGLAAGEGLASIVDQAFPEGFTLIDLRALRPILSAARTRDADPGLMRFVHGFDAVLVLTGSGPAEALP